MIFFFFPYNTAGTAVLLLSSFLYLNHISSDAFPQSNVLFQSNHQHHHTRKHNLPCLPIKRKASLLFLSSSDASSSRSSAVEDAINNYSDNQQPLSTEWELDCYSRPVVLSDGKKLWEVLLTDSSGTMRVCEALPSNRVNSRELRRVIEKAIDEAEVKPRTIRFFRGAMFNMINIALSEVDVTARPSRCTYALAQWLMERHRDVYPKMEGYRANMRAADPSGGSFLDIRTPVKLPDALRGERYAFVMLPLSEFREGGDITGENIGVGKLCPLGDEDAELPSDSFVQGLVIFSSRAEALATWLAGAEVSSFKCDLRRRELVVEADISTQFLMSRLNDVQRAEAVSFEEGKDRLNGLHFVSIQQDEEADPSGFWLLREISTSVL